MLMKSPSIRSEPIAAEKGAESRSIADPHAEFGGLLEAAPDGMLVAKPSGEIVLLNARAESIFGYARGELRGEAIAKIVPIGLAGQIAAAASQSCAEALARPAGAAIELVARRKDGSEFPIEVTLGPMESAEGILIVAAIRDIALRKAAEVQPARAPREISLRHEVLGSAVEESPVFIYIRDLDHRFTFANTACAKLLGFTVNELVGKSLRDVVPYQSVDLVAKNDDEIALTGGTCTIEEMGQINGVRRYFLTTKCPYRDSDGKIIGTMGISRETTERKKAEEVQLKTLADLKRSNDELEQFAYVASHDLQEPLRMVASYTQLLAQRYKGRLDADADEFIGFAVDGANRMQALIRDLLAYSRAGTARKAPREISTEKVLEEALVNLRSRIAETGAIVTHGPLPVTSTDDSQLVQVFQNLIGNAIKYRRAEVPRVHVSAAKNGPEWIFSVQDNGLGIDPRYFEKIFVIFQRLHGRKEFEGTGIGLAICRKIVERFDGRIWVESQIGAGSTFHFTLPEGVGS
jgi:PAS domain S-box-containing protein